MPGAPSVKGWIMTAAKEGKDADHAKNSSEREGEKQSVDFRAFNRRCLWRRKRAS
jgi:inhibitor of cysteine peptidase